MKYNGFSEVQPEVTSERYVSHRFFDFIPEIRGNDFENYVLDVNVVYGSSVGRKYVSELFSDKSQTGQALETLGSERFDSMEKNGKDIEKFVSTPNSRNESVQQLYRENEIYMPDIVNNCLRQASETVQRPVFSVFQDISTPLGVKTVMGVEEYTTEGLNKLNNDMDEDDAIVAAARNLEGPTCILTYDEDMIEGECAATLPEIARALN